MNKTSTKRLFLFTIFTLFTLTRAFAQTITVGSVDAGPYGQGSTITVPISINDASGCIGQTNTFQVYLSDASGNFVSGGTLIGSYAGFYTPFVNGVIPNGTPPGTGYKVRVVSTAPASTSTTSAAFTINGNAAVTASVSSSAINASSPEVFGRCIGLNNAPFVISNTSAPGTTVTASFFNEQTQAFEGTDIPIPAGGYTFTAKTSNYTVIVKTVDGSGTIGTHSYQLVNNLIRSNIGSTGNGFVCLVNGQGDLSFNIDISSLAGGIQVNYPGNTYVLDWGDGTSTVFTFCQLKALNGIVTHTFTLPSCGKTGNGVVNSFYVSNQPQSPYCGQISAPPGVSAKVMIVPITSFTAPSIACAGTALTIPNTSQPGPDPNNNVTATCDNDPGTLYDWYLDGNAVVGYQGVPLSKSFVLPANTPAGTHTLLLHTELGGGYCPSTDYIQTICLENPPQPAFTIPNEVCITAGPVTPTNTSVTDATCSVAQYTWTVTGPAPVNYAGGTNANSKIPQFVFTAPGVYKVQLGINSSGCGQIVTPQQTILIDAAPTATLSPDVTMCGTNLTLTFSNTQTLTKTIFSGTAQTQATTYTWSITGGAFSFAGGTNANSQYPKILFKDFATYTISVTHQNSCGTVTDTQKITFAQAPIVDAGPDQTVCASSPATQLAGSVTGAYTSYQWVGGNGTFAPNRNTLNAVYTPSAAEVVTGNVTLTLQANAALPAPCNIIIDNITINITPTPMVTSPPTAAVCSGQPVGYTITANYPATTFTWTAALTSGTATGFAAGSGNTINNVITNTGITDAVVTYTITPTLNGCSGPPYAVKVSVHPLPVITAVPANSPNCNSQPANIVLASNMGNTSYTWTSTGSGITGNTTQSTPLLTNSIQDILVNSGTTPATVTYTITPYNGTCPGAPVIATVTIEPSPKASIPGPDEEICNATTYTLHGNNPSPGTGKWTVVQGPAGVTFSDDTNPNAVASGLTPGNIYQFQWTITGYPSCPTNSNVVNITDDLPPVGGTTSAPAIVCSGSNVGQITLSGQLGNVVRWESSLDNGSTWQPIVNTGNTQSYLNLTQTTQYRAIVQNGPVCGQVASTATIITVSPQTTPSIPGPDDLVCSVTSYTLQGNNPTPGTGKWTVVSGPPGATFSDDTDPHAVVNNLTPGNIYKFMWTITGPGTCPANSNTVNITIEKAPVGGTAVANPAIVCVDSNNGQISLTGQFGTIVRWESSIDNGSSWQPIANTGTVQNFLNLTQTTQYRAILHNGTICTDVPSAPATVTVMPLPVTANAGPNDIVCSVTTYNLHGNDPSPGTGKWTLVGGPPGATFSDDTDPNAVVSNLQSGNIYQFKWTITGSPTCPSNSSVVNITIEKAPVGGTTLSDATVCSGSNSGQITLTGQFGTVVRWESSIDNGASWLPIANNGTNQSFLNLTQTTQYRAILHNGSICSDVPSTVTTIKVGDLPVASVPGPDEEVCSTTTYTLHGNSPLPGTGKWTVASGPPGATFSDDTDPNAVVSNLTPGSVYQFKWTITGSPSCPPSSNIVTITIDKAPVGGTTTANPAVVCSGSNNGQVTLAGQYGTIVRWETSIDNGVSWQQIANVGPTLSYSNLTQTTQYRVILHNGNVCSDVSSSVAIITVQPPPIASLPGPDEEICNVTSYTLHANNPAPGTGKWTIVTGPPGATFSDDTNPNAVVSNLIPGNLYQFKWTITGSGSCPPNSNVVNITIDKAPVGGTTTGNPAIVCAGVNTGQVVLTGQFGTILRWESSVDNGATWQQIANVTTTQSYANLTQTTIYRAILQTTGLCGEVSSAPSIITVNPQTPIADAGKDYNICNQTTVTLRGNDPSPFIGVWTQTAGPPVNILNPNSAQTDVTGLAKGNVYTFKWTIKGLPPCGDTYAFITIGAYADVIPSFTMTPDHSCGPITVKFTNTSTPAPTGTFQWDFGDGSPIVTGVNPPDHTFAPSADGSEITYKITLTPTSNCNIQAPYVQYLKVSPLVPVAKLLPNQTSACGAFTLIAKNLSPGNNAQYDFYLKDQNGAVVQHLTYPDTRDAVFQTINPTVTADYTVYVVATDKCGNQATSIPVIISLAPSGLVSQVQIKGDVQSVCLGSPVTFQNISTGGDRFTITIYDANKNVVLTLPAGTEDMNYTPTAIGTYYVSITAGNNGCGDAPASALKQFVVSPIPDPAFTYTADQDYNVIFTNNTPDDGNIPAPSITYKWDFGDGTTDNAFNPGTHHFDFSKSPFTVTLTATTPGSDCMAITKQIIDVKFQGNLFLPNAFIPASQNRDVNVFMAKGTGIKKWKMQIFNNWGQLVWETTKLDANGSPVEGWDGTYKGQLVQQGVYIWQISATLINGEEWRGMTYNNSPPSRTGPIHLIR